MGFFERTKGAVSIFLVIILLPVMTIGGVMIDVGRTSLASEVALTSADLALNTVLTAYDKDLKNYYGLLASCQDTSEVIKTAKDYFVSSMVSCGVNTSEAGEYFDNVVNAVVGEKDIRDMLQISVKGDVNITNTANGAMNNPALIKEGIVEFMKYRSPINGVTELFDKILESGVDKQLEAASYETTMTDKKREFYEAEEKLYDKAQEAYNAIKAYENFTTHTGQKIADEAFLDNFSRYINNPTGTNENLEDLYKKAHIYMVKDLYNTHNATGTTAFNLLKKSSIAKQSASKTYSDSNRASAKKIKQCIDNMNSAMKTYYNRANALTTAWNRVGNYKSNSDYALQYWVTLTDTCKTAYTNYVAAAELYWLRANQLKNAVDFAAEEAMLETMSKPSNSYVTFPTPDESNKLTYQQIYDVLMAKYNADKGSVQSGNQAYRNINSQITAVSSSESWASLSKVNFIYDICNKLKKYKGDFEGASKLAAKAKNKVGVLSNALDEYRKAFEAWEIAANVPELSNSELAEADRTEIENLKDIGIDKFSKESVTQLQTRLGNIVTLCDTFGGDIKKIKYFSTSILDIYDYKTFRSAAKLTASKIVRNASQLDSYATSSFSFTHDEHILRIIITDGKSSTSLEEPGQYHITDSFKLDLSVVAPNLKKAKDLYDWLMDTFPAGKGATLNKKQHGFDVSSEESADDAGDALDESADSVPEEETTDTKGQDMKTYSGATLPSKDAGAPKTQPFTANLKEVASFASSLFSDFASTFKAAGVNVRDDLFGLDYMKSMFTYDTFDYEGYYKHLSEDAKKKITASNADTTYYTDAVKNAWKSDDERLTLKLVERNAENNFAYCGELEYILYGNDTNVKNKNSVYAKIFMIRYALDLAPVFKANYNHTVLDALAKSLQAFAYIPEALTKTVACLAITAAEAALDIKELKKGIPVLLIKTDEQVTCSFDTLFKSATQQQKSRDGFAMQYSDYLTLFMFMELMTADENVMYCRTADLIQANLKIKSKDDDYALSKAQVFYDFKATVTISPMWSRLLAIDDIGDLSTSEGWRSVSVEMRRGY